jgi:hypothetical protein
MRLVAVRMNGRARLVQRAIDRPILRHQAEQASKSMHRGVIGLGLPVKLAKELQRLRAMNSNALKGILAIGITFVPALFAAPAAARAEANILACVLNRSGGEFKGTCEVPCSVNALAIDIDGPNPAARFQRWSLSGSHSNRSLASPALGGCSFLRGGRAERHSAVQRIP